MGWNDERCKKINGLKEIRVIDCDNIFLEPQRLILETSDIIYYIKLNNDELLKSIRKSFVSLAPGEEE